MQRLLVLVVALAVALVAATLVLSNSPAEAGKPLGNDDLAGSFAWVASEIRLEDGVLDHCSGFGTIEFFGDGTAWNSGTSRCCSAPGTSPTDEWFNHAVAPDGSFQLWERDSPAYQTHCRVVDMGRHDPLRRHQFAAGDPVDGSGGDEAVARRGGLISQPRWRERRLDSSRH